MAPKKALATGAAALQPLDPNQETFSLREARSQKATAGPQSGECLPSGGPKPEEEGCQPNTSRGGTGPGDQGLRSDSPASIEEEGKYSSASRISEED